MIIRTFPPAPLRSASGRAFRHSAIAPASSLVAHCVRSSVQWPFATFGCSVAPCPNADEIFRQHLFPVRKIFSQCLSGLDIKINLMLQISLTSADVIKLGMRLGRFTVTKEIHLSARVKSYYDYQQKKQNSNVLTVYSQKKADQYDPPYKIQPF